MADESDFKFDDKLRQQIHYDWGKYYKRLGKNESARKQFFDSLSLKENAHGPLEQLSKCFLEKGDASKALEYANECLKNHPKIKREKYHRNECIYDCNEFEMCLVERYKMWQENNSALGSVDAIKMTELTLEKSIGNETGSFLDNFQNAISELDKIKADAVDTRPAWKIRRDKGECDVVSICSDSGDLTKSETDLHPLDLYELRKKQKLFRSMYFTTPTIDTHDFLKSLTNDPRLNFPPSKESAQIIRNAIEKEIEVFKIFETMLRHRQPMYAKKIFQRKKNEKKFNKSALERMQKTTENRAKNQLKKVQQMRSATDFSRLLTFVEDIMTNVYLIQSVKVFPKKYEFLETIYNIVGNCFIDNIAIPTKTSPSGDASLLFESTFHYHLGFSIPKKFNLSPGFNHTSAHFLKRFQLSDLPVEKCYLLHQLSRLHFERKKYMESKEMGDEMIKISTSLNNFTWMLLGYVRVMLVDASLGAFADVKDKLEAMRAWKSNVKEPMWNFLETTVSKMM